MSLWTAKEAESATGGRAIGDWTCDGVSIDTRTLAPGDLFVALKDVRDGHDFVAMALEKGAGTPGPSVADQDISTRFRSYPKSSRIWSFQTGVSLRFQ